MKKVKVFQLREPTIMAIPENSSEIQYHCMSGRPPIPLIGDEQPYAMPMAETVTCPVHCLKYAVKGDWVRSHPGFDFKEYRLDESSDVWIKTQYIAMEPKLFKMLDTVIRQPYEEREQVRAARTNLLKCQLVELERRVENFRALPWYKRIWLAITKDC